MTMTTPLTTPYSATADANHAVRSVRSRRLNGIMTRHASSCRIRGFGI